MNGAINMKMEGRWGNLLTKYAFARGYAQRHGCELHTNPWPGQRVFEIYDPPIEAILPQRYDMDLEQWDGQTNIELTGWGLHQKCLLYSRADLRRWFTLKPEMKAAFDRAEKHDLVAHLRHGDFVAMADYIAVSRDSYDAAARKFGLPHQFFIVSADNPTVDEDLVRAGLGFLPDFFLLMRAKTLMRANSTFSLFAAWLGENERVFAPNLEGIVPKAGVTQPVPFVEGNWPAISKAHPNCSDLHLRP